MNSRRGCCMPHLRFVEYYHLVPKSFVAGVTKSANFSINLRSRP
jgi:hypothetical protein